MHDEETETYSQWGLHMNFNKTKYMAVNSELPCDLLIDDLNTLTPVTHCKYLGLSISSGGGWSMETDQRIRDGT
jgi:hypothetical protein